MKKFLSIILILTMILCSVVCYAVDSDLTQSTACYTMYAVTTGKADAILLKSDQHAFLIDTGYAYARGKILYAMDLLDIHHLDGVIITHTDNDHTDGLEWLAQSDISIDAWYASAMYIDVKDGKHPVQQAAAIRKENVVWLKAGDSFNLGEATLDVLAPGILFDDKDDNNSLVMMFRTPYGNMLLCGDMEYPQEAWLLNSGADVKCDVLKVPNHADDDVCSQQFLSAAASSVAVISTDTQEKPETPDPSLMQRLSRFCSSILQTQHTTGGVMVSLTPEGIQTSYVSLPEGQGSISITKVDSSSDIIHIQNIGDETIDVSDWYMTMDKKDTLFVFPHGTILEPGCQLTIGSRSSSKSVDYLWNEKKLINKKKPDGVTLYDCFGNVIAYADNGL